ncbi:hypothetical protein D3C75_1036070 [compost metagenome]
MGLSDEFGFLDGLLRPGTGHDIAAYLACSEQVHRKHGELCACAALQEQHLVAGRKLQKLKKQLLGLVVHRFVFLAAVGYLHDGHADPFKINNLFLRLLQYFQRERRRPCIKIIGSSHEIPHQPFTFVYMIARFNRISK